MSSTVANIPTKAPGQDAIAALLAEADIEVNGDRPWDMRVHNPQLYRRLLSGGSLALGETYMDGWWDCDAVDVFFHRILRAGVREKAAVSWRFYWNVVKAYLTNPQRAARAYHVGEVHYDKGNDLYQAMLDERLVYSCGYWKGANTLEEAQAAKLDLVCRKIGLAPGDRVLDIGCGWGSFARFAARTYGAEVVGITVSEEQAERGRARCAGFPVEIRLQDYRDLDEMFDHVVSIGMFEHVGPKNYATYMQIVKRCLSPDGLFLLHTIGASTSSRVVDPWIDKYIFPGGVIPSATHIAEATEGRFVIEDWHNIGAHYDPTLMAWHRNVTRRWDALADRYDERFRRMWTYYLLMSAGNFRARANQVWQIVFSHNGRRGGYESVR